MRLARPALVPAIALLLSTLVSAASPADSKPPTRPNGLRVTGVAPYSVSLSWNASSDNSGAFSYVVQSSSGYTMTVPQSSTTATFGNNLFPRNSYSFFVYAVDGAGNRSSNSNTVRSTQPADASVPGRPAVTLTDVGAHHASLAWSASDDDPYLSYFVYVDGVQVGFSSTATSDTLYLPEVSTSYAITVKARDHGLNFSPTSVPLIVTTEPVDTSDVQPPTAPAGFDAWHYPFDRELFLSWTQSSDDVDAQEAIRYEVHVNGELAEIVIGTGATITYGEFGPNAVSIVAIDSAGNASDPVTVFVDI